MFTPCCLAMYLIGQAMNHLLRAHFTCIYTPSFYPNLSYISPSVVHLTYTHSLHCTSSIHPIPLSYIFHTHPFFSLYILHTPLPFIVHLTYTPSFHCTSYIHPSLPQVPSSYVSLQQVIAEEVKECQQKEIPPVLNQREFAALADKIPESDISDPEELSLGKSCVYHVI